MKNYDVVDIENWNRKELYEFFKTFEEPYFGITAIVDVTKAYINAKTAGVSFFSYYLHASLSAVQLISAFRYRILDDNVIDYHTIHASATIERTDGSFGFSFIEYDKDRFVFMQNITKETQRISKSRNLFPDRIGDDVIHYSALPWVNFTSLSHARKYKTKDSVPKISFGKSELNNGKRTMACSVHAHHGLADGKDVGQYFSLFQTLLDS